MSIKLVDSLSPMGSFPVAEAKDIVFADSESLQQKLDDGSLGGGGGDSSTTLTQEEYEALPEEQKLNGLYYAYDTKRIYKNGVQYGASDAEGIGYNNAESGIQATTVQGAIDKVYANLGELLELKTTEKSNLVGAINEVVGNIETSSQILTPLFSEETGNKVVLYKMGKLRMISPMCILPTSRPIMTYFDAYQLPEDSYPSNKIWCIMDTIEKIPVDLTIGTREEGGKIQIRYRDNANHTWIPPLFWIVD